MPVKFLVLGFILLLMTGCFSSQQKVIIVEKSINLQNISQHKLTNNPTNTKRTKQKIVRKVNRKINKWSIPVKGNISETFSRKNKHLGLTFNTKTGQNVRAIRDGEVVYVGNKIKNHGKMIIIRHPFGFYSLYTQNKDLIVENGDVIIKGQIIAITSKVPFYFEMKKFKQPINPLKYLK
ncbi:M23 family metallopeptidase [Candidatus Ruthia endofausta]|uniref:M23 family metallopeptidase n=1 Tax=Candidatus Ruthia endofausta TaxID=2738852 RepID=A0A6N0HPC8_9GAMM|nr:M23 family metallopeptidase [Candidatus Ruthia endofausta]QKQ24242.1 M23 family metallopeptidase [Candidatus Ruthia endofausta]